LKELLGSHHKEGTLKMSDHNIVCAGIDTGKHKLDAAVAGTAERVQVDNTPDGHAALSAWLRRRQVERVGIEATGLLDHDVAAQLRRDGFTVIRFQPIQVRYYARFHLQRAKNDRIDAALIADCAAAKKQVHAPPDPRFAPFAERLTMIDQITEDVARIKTRRATTQDRDIKQAWADEIKRLKKQIRDRLKALVADIRQYPDLAQKLDLIASIDSIGLPSAAAILIRMPEIGTIAREQAAALAGLAPYDDDSSDHVGQRHIEGGRERLRKAIYNAAFTGAFHWNEQLKALYKRLRAKGKHHKVALIACARKLLAYANAVVARGTPWTPQITKA
jgi:transposase